MQTIGIDLGGTKISAGVISPTGEVLARKTVDTDHQSGDAIIRQLIELAVELRQSPGEPLALGIAIPGWVDAATGQVVTCPNIPLVGVPLVKQISAALGCEVRLENDANCAALGEQRFGAAKGCQNIVLLTLGTGLGGGAIVNGQLLSGVGSAEFGHIMMVRGGLLCGCGRHGCREVYTSATALIRMANEHAKQPDRYRRAKEIFDAIAAGDLAAKAAFDEYIGYLADAILDFISAFRPDRILIGGGITGAGEVLFAPLRAEIARLSQEYIGGFSIPPVLPAQNGNDAGILGAAALFF